MSFMHWGSKEIDSHPMSMLWHYAIGEVPCYLDEGGDEVGWLKYSHRGVQYLDRIEFPSKQKRYIFNPRFEVRYNQAFEQVVRCCGEGRPDGKTWLTPELIEGYLNLHRLGYAHSYETWQDGRLVAGGFGVQIGGYISCDSMFHRVSHAAKAAWGQTLLRLRDRGFAWIDTNRVASHHVQYGEQWVPQWKFEQMQRQAMRGCHSLADEFACPQMPQTIRIALGVRRTAAGLIRRLRSFNPASQPSPQ